ncbi:glycosyltransferase [Thermus oshimai JL-2]|uniref:Glycosyltransferase n=1 Tax=Thermus oshimai JL-2 TaxID=751945 RepID=K7QXL5_THEOS|nr:glycosyltransferase family 4 protein [Thermus oshimai]AFV76573.1 glycosyltransferase [Thermus oshimai JL-2]
MRVLFLSDAKTVGGSEIYLREILPRLMDLGLKPEAALPKAPGNEAIRRALTNAGVPVHAYTQLAEVPKGFDVEVGSAWFPQSYKAFFQHFPRLIPLVHDQIEIFYPLGGRYLYRLGYRLLQAPKLRRARGVITVSHWAARWLREVHRVPKVFSVPNGVDTERFRPPSSEERSELRHRFGFQRFSVLVPARMSPEKNHLAVLLTAKLLPELDFLLLGSGELEGIWRKTARLLSTKNVRFLGRKENMPELLRAADAVLLPTLGENQSLATLEAMASGLPVVTTPIPAQAELIEDGVHGYLVPPNPVLLSQRLRELAQNPPFAHRLGQQARRRILEEHTLHQTAARLKDVLVTLQKGDL